MRKTKKAQLQIGENVVVLIIFFFLLVIAVVFYAGIQKSKFGAKQIEIEAYSLLDLKTMVSALPEILCSENGDITGGCIDIINARIMSDYWKSIQGNPESIEREYYKNVFGDSIITVEKFDPITSNWTEKWVIYNESGNKTSSSPAYIPVSLYEATTETYEFGIVEVRRFTK